MMGFSISNIGDDVRDGIFLMCAHPTPPINIPTINSGHTNTITAIVLESINFIGRSQRLELTKDAKLMKNSCVSPYIETW